MSERNGADDKIDLLEQILTIEGYAERLEMWKAAAAAKGQSLGVILTRELKSMRQTVKTLELLRAHEKQFVALVRAERKKTAEVAGRSVA